MQLVYSKYASMHTHVPAKHGTRVTRIPRQRCRRCTAAAGGERYRPGKDAVGPLDDCFVVSDSKTDPTAACDQVLPPLRCVTAVAQILDVSCSSCLQPIDHIIRSRATHIARSSIARKLFDKTVPTSTAFIFGQSHILLRWWMMVYKPGAGGLQPPVVQRSA